MSKFTAVSILTEIQISALWANTLIRSAVSEPLLQCRRNYLIAWCVNFLHFI